MNVIIASALGGLGDDAAEYFAFILLGMIFLVIGGFLMFSWRMHSLVAARVACVFIFAVGVLFIWPWFFPGDDDANYYLIGRLSCIVWVLLIFTTVACFARAIRHQKSKSDEHNTA
jgi:peptidoglycan/LPS O-acetylase OafA/YrhL